MCFCIRMFFYIISSSITNGSAYIFLFFFENSVCFTEVKHYTNIIYGITLHRSTSSFFLLTLNSTICLTHSISLRKLSLSLVYLVYLVKYFISRVNIWKKMFFTRSYNTMQSYVKRLLDLVNPHLWNNTVYTRLS